MELISVLSAFTFWATVGYILQKFGLNKTKTISDHVAHGQPAKIYTVAAVFSQTLFVYLGYKMHLAEDYLLAYLLFIFVAVYIYVIFVPRLGDKVKAHDVAATLLGSIAILILVVLFFTVEGYQTYKLAVGLSAVAMVALSGRALNRGSKNYVYFQALFFMLFHVCALVTLFVLF